MAVGTLYPTVEPGWKRYEDTDPRILYLGAWSRNTTYSFTMYTSDPGASVTINFTGTKIRLLSNQWYNGGNSGYGPINIPVLLDGVPTMVSNGLLSGTQTSYAKQAVCFFEKTGLTDGPHTLVMQCTGATGVKLPAIALVDIEEGKELVYQLNQRSPVPDDTWRRFADDSHITRIGTWNWSASGSYYNNGMWTSSTNDPNRRMSFKFIGSKMRLISYAGPSWAGIGTVKIDGINQGTFTHIRSTEQYQTLLYEITGLDYKEHTVEIWSDLGVFGVNAIDIDKDGRIVGQQKQITIAPELGYRRIDDNNPYITRTGSNWSYPNAAGNTQNGYYWQTYDVAATIKFNFTGTRLRINSTEHTNRGPLALYIDGVKCGSLALNKVDDPTTPKIMFDVKGLDNKEHCVTITTDTGFIHGNTYMTIDSIDIDYDSFIFPYNETASYPLKVVRKLEDMEIGDMIPARYTGYANAGWCHIAELGTARSAQETNFDAGSPQDGLFYFVKVDRGLLVADRNLSMGQAWTTIDYNKHIEGKNDNVGFTSSLGYQSKVVFGVSDTEAVFYGRLYPGYPTYGHIIQAFDQLPELIVNETDFVEVSYDQYTDFPTYHTSGIQIVNAEKHGNSGNRHTYGYCNAAWAFMHFTAHTDTAWHGIKYEINMQTKQSKFYKDGYYQRETAEATWWSNYYQNTGAKYIINLIDYLNGYTYNVRYNWFVRNVKIKINGVVVYDLTDPAFRLKAKQASMRMYRSLSGGCIYLGADGNPSPTDKGLGAWPPDNEWDRYIANSSLNGKIEPGDNKVWHHEIKASYVQETPSNNMRDITNTLQGGYNYRMHRGYKDGYQPKASVRTHFAVNTTADANIGFRPVLEYVDNTKSLTQWV